VIQRLAMDLQEILIDRSTVRASAWSFKTLRVSKTFR
jgi:hypothetical protein